MNTNELIATFEQHDNLLHDRAWSWHRTTGIDVEELYAECRIQFFFALEAYNPERGMKFTSFLTMWLNSELQMWVKKNFGGPEATDTVMDLIATELNPRDSAGFNDMVASMSADAQYICQTLLNSPEVLQLKGGEAPKHVRGAIQRHLRDVKWSWNRIWDTFKEVKSVLAA